MADSAIYRGIVIAFKNAAGRKRKRRGGITLERGGREWKLRGVYRDLCVPLSRHVTLLDEIFSIVDFSHPRAGTPPPLEDRGREIKLAFQELPQFYRVFSMIDRL